MQPTPDMLRALERNPWFLGLRPRERRDLLRLATLTRLRPGEMLFRQGDALHGKADGFFGLVSGSIKASTLRQDGREAILALLEAGNWFGEISLIDHSPRTHDATALGPVEVLMVSARDFGALMQRSGFARAIAALLAARVRQLYGLMEDATLRSTRARVARRLALLSHGDATRSPQTRPVVTVSQEALAMMLGVTRQTLNKELKLLERAGAVALGYGRIEIVSAAKLAAAG